MKQLIVTPCANRLLVILDAPAKLSEIIIEPENAKKESQFGVVVAIGPKTNSKGEAVFYPAKTGEKVMVSKYGGVEVKVENKGLKLFSCEDILATIAIEEVADAPKVDAAGKK